MTMGKGLQILSQWRNFHRKLRSIIFTLSYNLYYFLWYVIHNPCDRRSDTKS